MLLQAARARRAHLVRAHRRLAPDRARARGSASSHAFDVPLRQSLWVHLVEDRADLPNAIALNSFLVNAARVIGPALAGLLLARRQRSRVLRAQRAVVRRRDRRDRPDALGARARTRAVGGGFWSKWVEGYRFVSGFAPARAMLLLVAVLSWTINPYSSLMPVYAKDIYGGGPADAGLPAGGGRRRGALRARSISRAARRSGAWGASSRWEPRAAVSRSRHSPTSRCFRSRSGSCSWSAAASSLPRRR